MVYVQSYIFIKCKLNQGIVNIPTLYLPGSSNNFYINLICLVQLFVDVTAHSIFLLFLKINQIIGVQRINKKCSRNNSTRNHTTDMKTFPV